MDAVAQEKGDFMTPLLTITALWTATLIGGPSSFQTGWINIHSALCKASGTGETKNYLTWERGPRSATVICMEGKKAEPKKKKTEEPMI